VGNVEPGPEADFEHLPVEPASDPGTETVELSAAERLVDDTGEELVLVEAHAMSVAAPDAVPL
jgi:hypothetical protein